MIFMEKAIKTAQKSEGDIPVGCVIVKNGEVIAKTKNEKEKCNNSLYHAELLAINEAHKKLSTKILSGCTMFVTLEPCPMCAWAIINSRIDKIYFGAYDYKYGAFGSVLDLKKLSNSKLEIVGGILEEECETLLKEYFKKIRKNEKQT